MSNPYISCLSCAHWRLAPAPRTRPTPTYGRCTIGDESTQLDYRCGAWSQAGELELEKRVARYKPRPNNDATTRLAAVIDDHRGTGWRKI